MTKEWRLVLKAVVYGSYNLLIKRGFGVILLVLAPFIVFGTIDEVKVVFMEKGLDGVFKTLAEVLFDLGVFVCMAIVGFFAMLANAFKIRAFVDAKKSAECRCANPRDYYDLFRILFFNSDEARRRFYDV